MPFTPKVNEVYDIEYIEFIIPGESDRRVTKYRDLSPTLADERLQAGIKLNNKHRDIRIGTSIEECDGKFPVRFKLSLDSNLYYGEVTRKGRGMQLKITKMREC